MAFAMAGRGALRAPVGLLSRWAATQAPCARSALGAAPLSVVAVRVNLNSLTLAALAVSVYNDVCK